MFGFEKLEVRQKAIEYADFIYRATRSFSERRRFGLTSQMGRCAVPVSPDPGAGGGRGSSIDIVRFVQMAYGSLLKRVGRFHVTLLEGLAPQQTFEEGDRPAER
ncbi:MAG TPA: four helix bundle protein [Planctomycetaceae bacterium]|nr:four helix bundle protein [Planctomycetaceae bacterium]